MVEKWSKISDMQVKVGAAGSGLRCANIAVVEGADVLGKGQGFLELALEQAEHARNGLADENSKLRKMVLNAVNEGQSILRILRNLDAEKAEEVCAFSPYTNLLMVIFTAARTVYACNTISSAPSRDSQ